MPNIEQLEQDLHFVRQAVMRRGRSDAGPASVYWVWALYVLVGYSLIDVNPRISNWFFAIAGIAGGLLSWQLGKQWARRQGECDWTLARRSTLHFGGGIILAVLAAFALASVLPGLRGPAVGQMVVVLIGMVYFLAGVHFDRHFLWLGPLLIAGGILVGLIPRFGWTALGAVIALALVAASLLPIRRGQPITERPATE